MVARIGNPGLALLCLGAAGPVVAAPPTPVQCSAIGLKNLAPATSAPSICAHFVHVLGAATRTPMSLSTAPPRDGLTVELRFGPRGMASARVMRWRAGKATPLPVHELAISDRQFGMSDIDTLAGDIARGLTAGRAKGKG
jgi:hypothetical protein